MRALLLVAALALAPASFAAQLAEQRAVPQVRLDAAPLDLKPLAVTLRAALPTIQALDLAVPAAHAPQGAAAAAAVLPAVYEPARAQALLDRLAEGGAIDPKRPVEAAGPADAKKTISAVNAVLRDFTPEQLAALPQEKLAAVAAVLFDHMGARPASREVLTAGIAALSEASASRMLAQRAQPLRENLLNPGHNDMHPDDVEVFGVPKEVKPVEAGGVYRHYTTKEGYDAIVKSGLLRNGYVPYVQVSPGLFKKTFKDVGGLFLTKAGVDGSEVGVPEREFPFYVDVVLPAAVKVLEIEAGRIWLVPLPGRARGWVADYYRKWSETGKSDSTYGRMVAAVDAAGGPGPDLSVPVTVRAHGPTR